MTNDAQTLYLEALDDFKHEKTFDAQEKLKKVLELDPKHEDAYEALAVLLYNAKQYQPAIEVLKQWVALNPQSMMAHTNLSRCYVAIDHIAEAEREQAIAQEISYKAQLKDKKQSMPVVDYEEKIARYKQIIELDPADVLGYFSLGKTYFESGDKTSAKSIFEQAIKVNEMHSSSYMYLGYALEDLGEHKEAVKIYNKGIEVARMLGDMMPEKKMEARLRGLNRSAEEA